MPSMETSYRRQKAVLWSAVGIDEHGNPTVGAPEEISVRWESLSREGRMGTVTRGAMDPQASGVAYDAIVVVDRVIKIGSNMWLGELADWYGSGSAGNDDEVMQVITYNEIPDLKNRAIRRTAGLIKSKDVVNPSA